MKRKTIQSKFKDIDKNEFSAVRSRAVEIFLSYVSKKYGEDHIDNDYMKYGVGWSLEQLMMNRQYYETIYQVAVDWIEARICDYDAQQMTTVDELVNLFAEPA